MFIMWGFYVKMQLGNNFDIFFYPLSLKSLENTLMLLLSTYGIQKGIIPRVQQT